MAIAHIVTPQDPANIAMTPVKSGMLKAVGYDPVTSTLVVQFNKGTSYRYKGVPLDIYSAMVGAESVGSYFLTHVKGLFDPEKVEAPAPEEKAEP